ncbi:uncharacterized protein LOC122256996 [Penaeus japonicus]|uniref:uncharacterized protein LOC122256996 n=1 Tax=Penaeus japonicus TaxID=27405 RepID=UPI001C7176C5|nr:uncharacterized protein LOC122256996 [Penaeus japonicus]
MDMYQMFPGVSNIPRCCQLPPVSPGYPSRLDESETLPYIPRKGFKVEWWNVLIGDTTSSWYPSYYYGDYINPARKSPSVPFSLEIYKMKLVATILVCVSVASRVWAQDGSFMLDSRGVEVEQGLQPSVELFQNHQAFSEAFKERSEEMATRYSLGQVEYNDPDPEYTWAYEIDAKSTGDMKTAREERRGDVVVGQYSVMDPDGSLRVVDYSVAPGTGFQATVRKELSDSFQSQAARDQLQQYSQNNFQNQQRSSSQSQFRSEFENQKNRQQFQNQQNIRQQVQSQQNYQY